jgi:LAS superfamily LD-carboxypeptidase LdcB
MTNYDSNNADILTGVTERHLVPFGSLDDDFEASGKATVLIHKEVVQPFKILRRAAAQDGFDIRICSGFRSFERQRIIWNEKMSGIRPTFNDDGQLVVLEQLNDWQKLQAVMRWSALPGASRHHWGTDFDVYDANAMSDGYQIQLVPEECEGQGLFAPFHDWLSNFFCQNPNNFFRPYLEDKGGIAPELWHISYAPISNQYSEQLTNNIIRDALLCRQEIKYLPAVLTFFDDLVERFVKL